MTREERKKAIEVLGDMKVKIDIPKAAKTQNDRNWALDVAIKALENHDTFMKYSYSMGKHDALSQEPCDDAISREAVIAIIDKVSDSAWDVNDFAYDVKEYICQLPSVTHKSGKWIPFSERLPKPFEYCLITTKDGEVIYHYDDGHYSKYKAWMPLPEPYEPQESEDKE